MTLFLTQGNIATFDIHPALLYYSRWSECGRTHPHLGLLLLRGVDNGGAADLGQLATLTVEGPAADLVPDHVFDEEDTPVEAERQPVEQLDVLQQVVV